MLTTVGPDHPLFVRIARGKIFSKWRRKSLQRLMGFAILDWINSKAQKKIFDRQFPTPEEGTSKC